MTARKPRRKIIRTAESFDDNFEGYAVTLTRIDDNQYDKLQERSLVIFEDRFMLMRLFRSSEMHLAKIYFVLNYLLGDSSECYDDWKGAFAYPFTLDIKRGERTYPYMLKIWVVRSSLEFTLRRIVESRKLADGVYHNPFDDEFSREEINYFFAFYYGYLLGRLGVLLKRGVRPKPFVHYIQSNLILYGYSGGRFFQRQFNEQTKYLRAYETYKLKIEAAEATG